MIKPKAQVPNLKVNLINNTQWELKSQESDLFTMIVFYRGLHCPICKKQLESLAKKLDDFSERGIHLVAISCDTEEKAKKTGKEWNIPELPVGYGFSVTEAQEWGLFISESISGDEPQEFSEPGLFLIRPDHSLYASSIQSMPFARPHWDDVLDMLDYVKKKAYPARGAA